MSKSAEGPKLGKEGSAERISRVMRNLNILGALALSGAAMLFAPAAPALEVLAGIDVAQAGGFEVARRAAKRRRTKK